MKLHSETNTLLPGNSMPRAEPEQEAQALTTMPHCLFWINRRQFGVVVWPLHHTASLKQKRIWDRQCGIVVRAWASRSKGQWFWLSPLITRSVVRVLLSACCFLEEECFSFCGLHQLVLKPFKNVWDRNKCTHLVRFMLIYVQHIYYNLCIY